MNDEGMYFFKFVCETFSADIGQCPLHIQFSTSRAGVSFQWLTCSECAGGTHNPSQCCQLQSTEQQSHDCVSRVVGWEAVVLRAAVGSERMREGGFLYIPGRMKGP